ncbi:ribonuclease P protein component [Microbacteriaceae bacterium VKM Ac-2855]|nr:ribonuclease P protein component [Microbacteriaceae bacterium VKM Ac-2855]
MLARANRITLGDDYRNVVRRGVRSTGPHTVSYVRRSDADAPARFGFIVAKTVGKAVTRNTVRRRLKAIAHDLLADTAPGTDVVIRALPGIVDAAWPELHNEIRTAMARTARPPRNGRSR